MPKTTSLDDFLTTAAPPEREVINTRDFALPPEKLFAAFSDPTRVAQWWGPNGFTDTTHQFEFRPGGTWKHTMHGPDGTDFHNEATFLEIAAPGKIVLRHEGPMHRFLMFMTYVPKGAGTTLTWRLVFESLEEVAKIRTFILAANEQNFDRLQTHLAATA